MNVITADHLYKPNNNTGTTGVLRSVTEICRWQFV